MHHPKELAFTFIMMLIFIYQQLNSTYTGKCVSVILVTFLLSNSLYLILLQTYTAYLGLYGTLDNMDFTLDNMDFTLDNTEFNAVNRAKTQSLHLLA